MMQHTTTLNGWQTTKRGYVAQFTREISAQIEETPRGVVWYVGRVEAERAGRAENVAAALEACERAVRELIEGERS